jgi:GDPmannose 4,6-dehydratase
MTSYLITGVTGQIGSYAAEQLVAAGHTVYGMVRGQKTPNLPEGVVMVRGDLADSMSLRSAIMKSDPEVVFNFGAVTAIGMSWDWPLLTADVTGMGVLRLLEACRQWNRNIRVVQASTADQFGNVFEDFRDFRAVETTGFEPRSPYGVAKQFAHDTCLYYRNAYGMHVSTAIQFNCTSPRHGDEFVVRKVTRAVARISKGKQQTLHLGNLDAVRDWSHAEDVARAYPLIAVRDVPSDFILSSGRGHSLKELVVAAFASVGLDWEKHVAFDQNLVRPIDVPFSVGNPRRANEKLGWRAERSFEDIIKEMVLAEMNS